MAPSKVMKPRKATKPKHSLKNTLPVNKQTSKQTSKLPPRSTTPLSQVKARLAEPPTTPVNQIIEFPKTPMAPRKRTHSEVDAEEIIDLDTSPSRLLELVDAAPSFQTQPAINLAVTIPGRPQSMLSKQGLAVTSSTVSAPRSAKRVKRSVANSQVLIQETEADPAILAHLSNLVDTGRRSGGSPCYIFKRGNSSISYEYHANQDEGPQSLDEEPRRKRDVGNPLTSQDKLDIRSMYFKTCHIPETIDFDIK